MSPAVKYDIDRFKTISNWPHKLGTRSRTCGHKHEIWTGQDQAVLDIFTPYTWNNFKYPWSTSHYQNNYLHTSLTSK